MPRCNAPRSGDRKVLETRAACALPVSIRGCGE